MSAAQNTEKARGIVKRFYDGAARGEITSFGQFLAEAFELLVPPQLPWGGTFDRQGYLALLPRVAEALDFARMSYVRLTAEGGHVVALINIVVQGTDRSILVSEHWDVLNDQAIRLLVAYFDPTALLSQAARSVAQTSGVTHVST